MSYLFRLLARLSPRGSSAQADGPSKAKDQQIFTRASSGRNPSAAFTLVELLIVISIIGIMSSVVISSTTVSRIKARDVRRITDLKEIELALALYYDVNRSYPASLNDLVSDKYLPVIPSDPTPSKSYEYAKTSATHYCVGAELEGAAPTDIPDLDCAIPSSPLGNTTDNWFKASK